MPIEIFTSGQVVNPDLWVMLFPTGSQGLSHNLSQYLINELNSRGIFVAGAHFPGCDGGEEDYGARYFDVGGVIQNLMGQHSLTTPPVLYCQSRGGLQGLSFAAEAPSLVNRVAALYPVTSPDVYPGRGAALNLAHSKTDEEFDAIIQGGFWSNKPVMTRYSPNLKGAGLDGKPVCIWHGDSDLTVPKESSTDVFAPLCSAYVKTLENFGHQAPSNALLDEITGFIQWGTIPAGAVQR